MSCLTYKNLAIYELTSYLQGEALGRATKGLLEPIQPVGNVGSAGLGWPQGTKYR